ncbi:hypothetical protein C0J52_13345 [Blattella germanica]|nr:hypothetical protein C0J52_13345 [Blattella germanica]
MVRCHALKALLQSLSYAINTGLTMQYSRRLVQQKPSTVGKIPTVVEVSSVLKDSAVQFYPEKSHQIQHSSERSAYTYFS